MPMAPFIESYYYIEEHGCFLCCENGRLTRSSSMKGAFLMIVRVRTADRLLDKHRYIVHYVVLGSTYTSGSGAVTRLLQVEA